MKKIFLFASALFLFTMASNAQSNNNNQRGSRQHTEQRGNWGRGQNSELTKKLNLTADQQAKLKAVREDFTKQGEAIKNNSSLSADQKRAAYRELMQKNRTAQNAVYTDEQKEIIKKSMEERRAQRAQGGQNGQRGHRGGNRNGGTQTND